MNAIATVFDVHNFGTLAVQKAEFINFIISAVATNQQSVLTVN